MKICSNCGRQLTEEEQDWWYGEKEENIECDSCLVYKSETMYD